MADLLTAASIPEEGWPAAPELPRSPEADELPIDALPPALRNQVESVAGATQTPPDLATMLALAATSAALRGRAEVVVDARGWHEMAVVYAAVVMPPAARKSPVYSHMIAPLAAWEREALKNEGPAYRSAKDEVEVAAAALAATKTNAAKNATGLAVTKAKAAKDKAQPDVQDARDRLEAAEAKLPKLPRILGGDATPEALVRIMDQTGGPIALLAPEADPLGIADGRYSDSARVDELLRAWSGEAIRVDRVSREPLHVERPALTLGLCLQPAALDALKHRNVHRGRGLWGRVLWCVPPHGLGYRLTGRAVPPLDSAADDRYARVLRTLLDAARASDVHVLRLSAEALERVYDFEAEVERELADGERLAPIRDWAGKAVGQAVRLSALLELFARAEDGRPPWTDPIGAWAVDGGVRLMRALTTHALRVLGPVLDNETADLAYVLRRIRELPEGSTVRDVYMATRSRPTIADADKPAEALAELLDGLVERGCIRLHPRTSTGGRPPSPVVELHPTLRPPVRPKPVPASATTAPVVEVVI